MVLFIPRHNYHCGTVLFQSGSMDEPSMFEDYMELFQRIMRERTDAYELNQAYK